MGKSGFFGGSECYMGQTEIFVAIDLGGDTLKAVYTFSRGGRDYLGKLVGSRYALSAIDAVAKYDTAGGQWLYAEDVNNDKDETFVTVVKIKSLLSLLSETRAPSEEVFEKNKKYYFKKSVFPKFYFPVRKEELGDYAQMEKNEMTFPAEGYTPQSVCEGYFAHVADVIERRIGEMADSEDISDYRVNVSVVSPPHTGEAYEEELGRLVAKAFDRGKVNVFPMTKALGYYAINRNLLAEGESALIFNVGDEKTFVVKVNRARGMGMSVDGVDGHNSEKNLGGRDIDGAIADYLEKKIRDRETPGTPSPGEEGHIYERGLHSKQYLFLKNIGSAKIVLGINDDDNGVVINVARDLNIRTTLDLDEFKECVLGGDFYSRLMAYVNEELGRKVNKDVKKVFFTGGVVETCGLIDKVRSDLSKRGIGVLTFENPESPAFTGEGDGFPICAHEDAVYAPCLGCALAKMRGVVINTVTALTYGARFFVRDNSYGAVSSVPIFSVLLYSGSVLAEKNNRFSTGLVWTGNENEPSSSGRIYILSTHLSRWEIKKGMDSGKFQKRTVNGNETCMVIGDPAERRGVVENEKKFGMQNISDGALYYFYRGVRVEVGKYHGGDRVRCGVQFEAFADIDGTGRARVCAENAKKENAGKRVDIKILETKNGFTGGQRLTVPADEIEFGLKLGFQAS